MEYETALARAFQKIENEELNEYYFLTKLVARAAKFRFRKGSFPPRTTFEPAL